VGHEPEGMPTWHKGRPCDAGNCVEIAPQGEDVLVRSTMAPDALIRLTRQEWAEFLMAAKEGLLDHL
jgi:hypothetical protein